uniref:(northern house mosquito) hypothetical protein n=1 Tax=Culex pipiens TaxID=7175 RepID=A0A8D8KLF7_CULPI
MYQRRFSTEVCGSLRMISSEDDRWAILRARLNRLRAVCRQSEYVCGKVPGPEIRRSENSIFPSVYRIAPSHLRSLAREFEWWRHSPVRSSTSYCGRSFHASVATILIASRMKATSASGIKNGNVTRMYPGWMLAALRDSSFSTFSYSTAIAGFIPSESAIMLSAVAWMPNASFSTATTNR